MMENKIYIEKKQIWKNNNFEPIREIGWHLYYSNFYIFEIFHNTIRKIQTTQNKGKLESPKETVVTGGKMNVLGQIWGSSNVTL